jgi:hypothetical protein
VGSLWVITLTALGIGAAYVQPIAVTLVSRNLRNIAVTVTTIDIPVVAAVSTIVAVRVIHACVAVATVTIIAITLTLPFAPNSLIAISVAPILAVTPRPLRLSCCARDYRNTEK